MNSARKCVIEWHLGLNKKTAAYGCASRTQLCTIGAFCWAWGGEVGFRSRADLHPAGDGEKVPAADLAEIQRLTCSRRNLVMSWSAA